MKSKTNKTAMRIFSAIAVIIGILGWILNMGFNRFIFTLFGVPIVMLASVITLDIIAAKYYEMSGLLLWTNILFNISYMCANVFLPDGMMDPPAHEGEASESYMIFSLIHNSDLYEAFMSAALLFFGIFVLTLIFQTVWLIILKCRRKRRKS